MRIHFCCCLVVALCLSAKAQVYLDSEAPDGGEGTQTSPFNEVADVTEWKANTTYNFKRGGNFYISNTIAVHQDNVTLDAYGTGERPRIYSDMDKRMFRTGSQARNPAIKNLFFDDVQTHNTKPDGANMIDFTECIGGLAYKVRTRRGGKGICAGLNDDTLRIIGCEVTHTKSDALWFYYSDVVIIDSLFVDSINTHDHGGDCIQYCPGAKDGDHTYKLIVKNSFLDHRAYEGKFNIMIGSYSNNPADYPSLYAYNTQMFHYGNGHNIYTNEMDSVVIDRCVLSGGKGGIYKGYWWPTDYIVTRTIIDDHTEFAVHMSIETGDNTGHFYNNIFKSAPLGIVPFGSPIHVKNNIFYNVNDAIYVDANNPDYDTDYNCYFNVDQRIPDEANSVKANPKFVSATDYRLAAGSPCINAGQPQQFGAIDPDNRQAPIGPAWDIGVYEYCTDDCPVSVLAPQPSGREEFAILAHEQINRYTTHGTNYLANGRLQPSLTPQAAPRASGFLIRKLDAAGNAKAFVELR